MHYNYQNLDNILLRQMCGKESKKADSIEYYFILTAVTILLLTKSQYINHRISFYENFTVLKTIAL